MFEVRCSSNKPKVGGKFAQFSSKIFGIFGFAPSLSRMQRLEWAFGISAAPPWFTLLHFFSRRKIKIQDFDGSSNRSLTYNIKWAAVWPHKRNLRSVTRHEKRVLCNLLSTFPFKLATHKNSIFSPNLVRFYGRDKRHGTPKAWPVTCFWSFFFFFDFCLRIIF